MKKAYRFLTAAAVLLSVAACAQNQFMSLDSTLTGKLSDRTVLRHASGGALEIDSAQIITGNDEAFRSKLKLVESASETIDAMYYIYADDYSSSVLTQALIAAAQRGVRVRLLLDYHSNYKHLDLFSMMEKQGNAGKGSLQVRFFNRPTRNIVMDAAYMTVGCGDVTANSNQTCSQAKLASIGRQFAGEKIGDMSASALGISNLNIAGSGLLLSGLYGKNPDLMALAVIGGQNIDTAKLTEGSSSATAEDKENLKKIAKIYWASKTGPAFTRLVARIQLAVAFTVAGDTLNPIYDTVSSHLPIERRNFSAAATDWDHITDYLHHKLLFVDKTHVQLGGRNIEDSYHMRPNEMIDKYVFMDTDARLSLRDGGDAMETAFNDLWTYMTMVATIDEIRRHAPNLMAANSNAFRGAQAACKAVTQVQAQRACLDREFAGRALDLQTREAVRFKSMQDKAKAYWASYRYAREESQARNFTVDPGAFVAYIENLPFDNLDPQRHRLFGATNGHEAVGGKRIHALWLAGLKNACKSASKAEPKRVILHNAYFYPPSNLLKQFAEMVDGTTDCRNVTLTVLSNSIETTDLNVVNIFARHTAKAFAEYFEKNGDQERGARLEYFEYVKQSAQQQLSLHSKVSVLGDDMIVGSANADVRSYMMDSNNGVFIRNAPGLVKHYVRYIDEKLNDTNQTKNVTQYFLSTDRSQMLEEDRKTLRSEMAKYRAERWLDPEQTKQVEVRMFEMLDYSYGLAQKILSEDGDSKYQDEFNQTFKGI